MLETIRVENSDSIIGFETSSRGGMPDWDRYLTIDGNRAYHIGNPCDTCAFFFERLDGANQSVSASMVAGRLNSGSEVNSPSFVETLSRVLPTGTYQFALHCLVPKLVALGAVDDYFIAEQVELWGIDPFWALPHDPRIPYYRGRSAPLGNRRQLFEFIVPMFPNSWLDTDQILEYRRELVDGNHPTAFVLSVLDIKGPATWDNNPAITEHWCLAHYLLDVHHKIHAAATEQVPIDIISFLNHEASIASGEQIETALGVIQEL